MHQRHPITLSYVGHDSFHLCDMSCSYDTTYLYVWKCWALQRTKDETSSHDSFICWIWLIPFIGQVLFTCVAWLIELSIRVQILGSRTHPEWRHPMTPLYSGTWLTPFVEHVLFTWRDSFTYLYVWKHWALERTKDEVGPWLLHTWDMTHFIRVTWLIDSSICQGRGRTMTPSYVGNDSLHSWDVNFSHVWHDSCVHQKWGRAMTPFYAGRDLLHLWDMTFPHA